MAEPAANTPTSDYLWAELARLIDAIGLPAWVAAIHLVLWGDPESTEGDFEDVVAELRVDLLRLAAASTHKQRVCEVLEVALGHLSVHEWAALERPCFEERPLGAVIDLDVRPRPPDPVAIRALVAAAERIAEARELVAQLRRDRRLV